MTRNIRRTVAALLALTGAAALLSGVGAWMVSGCCGSPEPAEDGYLALGMLGALIPWGGAYVVLTRQRLR